MKYGSLFSGIGGMDLGFDRAGWACSWQVERDEFCQKVLAKNWPHVPRHDDIRTFTPTIHVDAIIGGFPCQPVSVSGRRKGNKDERWLWPEFARVLRILRPKFAVMENTPGLLTLGFGEVMADLAELGYDAEWSLLSACSMGAPHMRKRVFIVAYTSGLLGKEWIRFWESETTFAIPTGDTISAQVLRMETTHRNSGVPHGFSGRLDKGMQALGNAVVPQVAEWIANRIKAVGVEIPE